MYFSTISKPTTITDWTDFTTTIGQIVFLIRDHLSANASDIMRFCHNKLCVGGFIYCYCELHQTDNEGSVTDMKR